MLEIRQVSSPVMDVLKGAPQKDGWRTTEFESPDQRRLLTVSEFSKPWKSETAVSLSNRAGDGSLLDLLKMQEVQRFWLRDGEHELGEHFIVLTIKAKVSETAVADVKYYWQLSKVSSRKIPRDVDYNNVVDCRDNPSLLTDVPNLSELPIAVKVPKTSRLFAIQTRNQDFTKPEIIEGPGIFLVPQMFADNLDPSDDREDNSYAISPDGRCAFFYNRNPSQLWMDNGSARPHEQNSSLSLCHGKLPIITVNEVVFADTHSVDLHLLVREGNDVYLKDYSYFQPSIAGSDWLRSTPRLPRHERNYPDFSLEDVAPEAVQSLPDINGLPREIDVVATVRNFVRQAKVRGFSHPVLVPKAPLNLNK